MRIAVISDTHNRLPPQLPPRIADADEIWHLGDVCSPAILAELERLGKPLHVVLGNNDFHHWPLVLKREIGGARCLLTHIPPAVIWAAAGMMGTVLGLSIYFSVQLV